jgi:hypothetical protein
MLMPGADFDFFNFIVNFLEDCYTGMDCYDCRNLFNGFILYAGIFVEQSIFFYVMMQLYVLGEFFCDVSPHPGNITIPYPIIAKTQPHGLNKHGIALF